MTKPRPPLTLPFIEFLFGLLSVALAVNWWVALPEPWNLITILGVAIATLAFYMAAVSFHWWMTR